MSVEWRMGVPKREAVEAVAAAVGSRSTWQARGGGAAVFMVATVDERGIHWERTTPPQAGALERWTGSAVHPRESWEFRPVHPQRFEPIPWPVLAPYVPSPGHLAAAEALDAEARRLEKMLVALAPQELIVERAYREEAGSLRRAALFLRTGIARS